MKELGILQGLQETGAGLKGTGTSDHCPHHATGSRISGENEIAMWSDHLNATTLFAEEVDAPAAVLRDKCSDGDDSFNLLDRSRSQEELG